MCHSRLGLHVSPSSRVRLAAHTLACRFANSKHQSRQTNLSNQRTMCRGSNTTTFLGQGGSSLMQRLHATCSIHIAYCQKPGCWGTRTLLACKIIGASKCSVGAALFVDMCARTSETIDSTAGSRSLLRNESMCKNTMPRLDRWTTRLAQWLPIRFTGNTTLSQFNGSTQVGAVK